MTAPLPRLRLNAKSDRRLRGGHVWIYSNEVDIKTTPLKGVTAGQQVLVEDHGGKPLGVAYVNPHTLICGRLFSRDIERRLDQGLLVERIERALQLRQRFFASDCYRLVYGDSDDLPGLVVDRFGDVLVVQIGTAGMEAVKDEVVAALDAVLKPSGILLRNDSRNREVEQLSTYKEVVLGDVPELVPMEENGVRFLAPVHNGQKTGWFYDHRDNRAWLQQQVKGKRVLDVFSYIGGWGVQAAAAGAEQVHCVDSSAFALEQLAGNAALNEVSDRVVTHEGGAFDVLKQLAADGERYDVVVVDPPAFIPRRKDIDEGAKAYRRVNELALALLEQNGVFVSASCSLHLEWERLKRIVHGASRGRGRQFQIVRQGGLGADHPVHPMIPETDYLKALCGFVA